MNIVYWTNAALGKAAVIARLQARPDVELTVAASLDDVLAALPSADGLVLYDAPLVQARPLVAALAAPQSRVRWLHVLTAGREGLDAAGIPPHLAVSSAAGATAPAVAEHALALLLAIGRRLPESVVTNQAAKWDRSMAPRASSLEGATLAIIGYGRIGKEIARRARPFGPRIVAVSRTPASDDSIDAFQPLGELHAVLGEADAVAVAIALTPQTHHLFDARAFAACKPGALLVNVARGGVIDQTALREALASGHLGGAGLDVTDPEPLPDGDPLWSAPNILISPHYAGAGSPKSIERIAASVIDNLELARTPA
jgi:phosphoglycerate dehydrogenase-like enzyme